ncbi:MAG TPA: glycine betaine ABC transporter substrate-binding protein [Planctomycetota bacterium]|nr:glycine betaine ABC transporter substrate-binding protein [Planctomycetota bacterium]
MRGALLLAALVALGARHEKPVVVGSKDFIESNVLAEVMAAALEAHGVKVERRLDLGGTLICLEALRSGAIDVYPEYTGTGLVAVLDEPAPHDGLAALLVVRRRFAERFGLAWLDPFGFENTYVIAVRRPTAASLRLAKVSDLVAHAPSLTIAVSEEFLRRPDGLPALEERYGLAFGGVRAMSHELAYTAIARGKIDALDAYATDPELADLDLVPLEDDRRAFPPYHAAPVVRPEILERPEVRAALQSLVGTIDAETMRDMNREVRHGASPRDVARRFLARRSGAPPPVPVAVSPAGEIGRWTTRHVLLSGSALLAASLVGVLLGVVASRRPRLEATLLATLGAVETIPSLALLGLLLPLLGIGATPALAALFLYALLPIVRGTTTGLHSVDGAALDAATAMGLTPFQRLRLVELPLSVPSIAGGIRTSAVIVIGTATLAAFVGAGGLGEPIFSGVKLARPSLVLEGAIPAALLALGVDGGLALVERRLRRRPSLRRRRARSV